MNKYSVTVPFTGVIEIEVKAKNEKSAKEQALIEVLSLNIDVSSDNEEINYVELSEFQAHEIIAEGNLFHGCQNEISVDLIEE